MSFDTEFSQIDSLCMKRALQLAARGNTHPNPHVGCLIVRSGEVVGEGFHPLVGQGHAEVFALRQAGSKAKGATAYITLEPCCFQGRTPACTDALLASGVVRVVIAAEDPNPRVRGKGVAILREAGIEVSTGLLATESARLNVPFFHFQKTGTPYVTLKTAMTLDGKIATRTGASQWITGDAARKHVHRLRAHAGAVMTGIGTLLADNARLTARTSPVSIRQPLRVIVDSHLRTPVDCLAVQEAAPDRPLLIATTPLAPVSAETALCNRPGVEIIRLPTNTARVDLRSLVKHLAAQEINSVLCEAGAELNAALLEEGLVQRALFFIAPILFGGVEAPGPIGGGGVEKVSDAIHLAALSVKRYGTDIALEGDIAQQ